jgi:hypothetical protein
MVFINKDAPLRRMRPPRAALRFTTEELRMNIILVLIDSLNRHALSAYGSSPIATPNLDAFARRAWRFDNHFVGSLPCMPAAISSPGPGSSCGVRGGPWNPSIIACPGCSKRTVFRPGW